MSGQTTERPRMDPIEVGFQVFLTDGGEEIGAVRDMLPGPNNQLVIYVENAGDFLVPVDAVSAVHYTKVVLDCARLDSAMVTAIDHAHDAEEVDAPDAWL